ncbi:MAG: SRPBCC family protein [Leptospirales bacterium]|nr:SRPBCC family protein [Leptospirales bacterium]
MHRSHFLLSAVLLFSLLSIALTHCSGAPAGLQVPPADASHGDWVDYYIAAYSQDAHPSDRSQAYPRPWPEGYDPASNPVYTHNEIFINAPPARIFQLLLSANDWSRYYENAHQLQILTQSDGHPLARLGPGVKFDWSTFGATIHAEITEFEQDRVLAWNAFNEGTPVIGAYHRWILVPQNNGTLLITEECNNAQSPAVVRWLINALFAATGHGTALPAAHQHWLNLLKEQAESQR